MIQTDTTFTTRQVPWMQIGTVIEDPDVDAYRYINRTAQAVLERT